MNLFLRIYKHILPNGKAWQITIDKLLRRFFDALGTAGSDASLYIEQVWQDIDPQTTRVLDEWNNQWGLLDGNLTEQEQRDRLDGVWKALGGQSPRYIQDTLRNAGFDVYVHDWWIPGTEPPIGSTDCATARNPVVELREGVPLIPANTCGVPTVTCGAANATCGVGLSQDGYPLVNIIPITTPLLSNTCGVTDRTAGVPTVTCGVVDGEQVGRVQYQVPTDPLKWPYFIYIGGQNFPDRAVVTPDRREEFERLLLKHCPEHLWIGVLVRYE